MTRLQLILTFGLLVVLTFVTTPSSFADDWSRWMGPNRNNTWNETNIIDKFPEGGPKVLWRTPIASGFSGPAIADGKVVITDFVTDKNWKDSNFNRTEMPGTERVWCLNENTGEPIWKKEQAVTYSISYPAGPRCTPIIENGKVFTLGAEGNLFCFNLEDGAEIWSKDLRKEYNTISALWGYAGHPLIDGDNIITLVGGEDSHVAAFDKNTGDEVWASLTSKEQGYSPPSIIEAGGVRQLILLRPDAITSVNPADGNEYWSVPYEATSGSIIMTPIHIGDYLYVAGYSMKSKLLKLAKDKPAAELVWENKARDVPSPVNVQPFLDEATKIIYGVDQNGDLRASQLPDGKLLWATSKPISERRAGSGTAFVVKGADHFWLFNENGELIIADLNAEGYKEIDRAKVIEPTNVAFNRPVVWSMPAFANRNVYIRNDKEIICLDLSKGQ